MNTSRPLLPVRADQGVSHSHTDSERALPPSQWPRTVSHIINRFSTRTRASGRDTAVSLTLTFLCGRGVMRGKEGEVHAPRSRGVMGTHGNASDKILLHLLEFRLRASGVRVWPARLERHRMWYQDSDALVRYWSPYLCDNPTDAGLSYIHWFELGGHL